MSKYSDKIKKNLAKIMKILDAEGNYSFPNVKIVQKPRQGWAGICNTTVTGVNDDGTLILNSDISIQKFTLQNENIFYNVLAHECCHYVDLLNQCRGEMYVLAFDRIANSQHHGESFNLLANKINDECGSLNIFSEKNISNFEDVNKYVLLQNINDNIEYSYTCRPTKTQIAYLTQLFLKNPTQYKLIKSKKIIFNDSCAIIGKSWSGHQDNEMKVFLYSLWNNEKDILEEFLKIKLKPEFFQNIDMFRNMLT